MNNDILIIGAGIGGLATAIRLLHKGYKVKIIEKNKTIGGKTNKLNSPLVSFDLTASISIMIDEYIKLFKDIEKDYSDYFELIPLNPIYKVFTNKGDELTITKNINSITLNSKSLSINELVKYNNFLNKTYKKYLVVNSEFLTKNQNKFYELFKINTIKNIIKLNPIKNCYSYINKYINNEILKNTLLFQCMYIGVTPYNSSNMYTLIPTVTQLEGLYHIKGGTYKYIESLEKVIKELEGEILTDTEVTEIIIKDKKAIGVSTSNKENIYADIIICNSDFSYTLKELIKDKKVKKPYTVAKINSLKYSCSTFILHLGVKKYYNNLSVHNIFLNNNFKENINAPFNGYIPNEGNYYIYYPSKIDNSFNKIGYGSLNITLRVPNLLNKEIIWNKEFINTLKNKILNDISKINGLENIKNEIIYENYTTPITLKNKFNTYAGCAFGLSHTLMQTNYFRPQVTFKNIKNLYFTGASIHPGNGISLVLKCSELCANEIVNLNY
ncbi:phytoene desaturase family protein [Clostridium tarantellae]|uniref:Phytoene desaturase n=1 Tax=Clostridium tarantellae TaxID=39493 RepID=A0A6I1MIG0_9CLOT|nr:phytoene desaturase family protein [Clostridium tarantellae]MPQ43155.1 phytoene desaturase [Clostridium tarantellae]